VPMRLSSHMGQVLYQPKKYVGGMESHGTGPSHPLGSVLCDFPVVHHDNYGVGHIASTL
jgi:hypothetical protein